MTAFSVEDVTKRYGDTTALDGASLGVDTGEVVAVIGPNGAGKTTLVRCLTGTARPDAGDVAVLGEPPSAVDRERLGVLPQDFAPPDRLTARELVAYYGGLYRAARDPAAALDAVGLDPPCHDQRYGTLSGGERRRVCVAAAIVNDPDALVLDEPTTGIDPVGRRAVWDAVRDRAADGTGVLLTTHDMEEAERLADRVALIDDGAVVATGEPDALIAEHGGAPSLHVEPLGPDVDAAALGADRRDGALAFDDVASDEIQAVLDDLDAAGVDYEAVRWRQPALDDVFLAVAGGDGDA